MTTIINTSPITFNASKLMLNKKNCIIQENMMCKTADIKLSVNNYKANFLSFAGNVSSTNLDRTPKGNCDNKVKHQTSFFRDPDTIGYIANYINTECKGKKHISLADFGCAVGEEAYTIAMMANDSRLKIMGYDVSPDVIDIANQGIYTISSKEDGCYLSSTNEDHFLNKKNEDIRNKAEKSYHELFHRCFSEISNLPEDLAKNRHFQAAHNRDKNCQKFFKLNKKELNPSVSFEVGNINEIESVLKPGSTDIIVFKNALYHLLPEKRTNKDYVAFCLSKIDKLFKSINDSLKPGGIFVLGRLSIDHMATPEIFKQNNGQKVCNLPIHELLKANGFEPVHYDSVHKEYNDGIDATIFLPSVWQKK